MSLLIRGGTVVNADQSQRADVLCDGGVIRREHLPLSQRSHYVITDGGDQPNVVPSQASVWYYFREQSFDGVKRNFEIGNRIAEGATLIRVGTALFGARPAP